MCFLDLVDGVLLIPHTFDAIRNFTSNPLRYLDYEIQGSRLVQRPRNIEIDGSQLLREVRKCSAALNRSGI